MNAGADDPVRLLHAYSGNHPSVPRVEGNAVTIPLAGVKSIKNEVSLDHLRIASPCPVSWGQMTGGDRVRFCQLCSLHVYNFAEMTKRQVDELITSTEGRICARLYRRPDGTVITRDCPVGLRAVRRQVAKVAGAVFAVLMSLLGSVAGQKPGSKDKSSCQQQVKITRKVDPGSVDTAAVMGTVVDANGAVVEGANVRLTDRQTKKYYDNRSNAEGHFLAGMMRPGAYDVTIQAFGFKSVEVRKVNLGAKDILNVETILLRDKTEVTMGIVAYDHPLIDTTSSSTTIIISSETLRKLPIP